MKFNEIFESREDIAERFSISIDDVPREQDIIFAYYDINGYDGTAVVIWQCNGEIFLVEGSHCSCHGLEDQWVPERSHLSALLNRKWEWVPDARTALLEYNDSLKLNLH